MYYPIAKAKAKDIHAYLYVEFNGDMYKIIDIEEEEPDTVTFHVIPEKKDLHNPLKSRLMHKDIELMLFSKGQI